MQTPRRHRSRWLGAPILAIALLSATSATAWAAPLQTRDGGHHEVSTVYYPDDICGPRSGWTTWDVTWHLRVTDLGDAFQATYTETGKYSTDLDDPAFQDYTSQYTEVVHFTGTRGGAAINVVQFHDFPGTIRIRARLVFVANDTGVHVDRDILEVTGCP